MSTKTRAGTAKALDPGRYPAFAVTVDVVVLTVASGALQAVLIRRGVPPFAGMWAIPGGFKRPDETLDKAAWGVRLDGANFWRKVFGDEGWVTPTGRHARPGANGGKPAELYRPGPRWRQGGPIRRSPRKDGGKKGR